MLTFLFLEQAAHLARSRIFFCVQLNFYPIVIDYVLPLQEVPAERSWAARSLPQATERHAAFPLGQVHSASSFRGKKRANPALALQERRRAGFRRYLPALPEA